MEQADAPDTRERILQAAFDLLRAEGREAVTTRAVAAAASVQAPILYRLFRDKNGLLDALAEYGFAVYLRRKRVGGPTADLVQNLRAGWDLHVEFGLENPGLFLAMYGNPRTDHVSPAAKRALAMLTDRMTALAAAGRLNVEIARAAELVRATACGIVLTLLEQAPETRDPGLSVAAREAVLAAIIADRPVMKDPALNVAAVTMRALLPQTDVLSKGERQLMQEWLDRLSRHS